LTNFDNRNIINKQTLKETIMKKYLRVVFLVAVCLAITLLAAGCSAKGNTYVYEDTKIVDKGDYTEDEAKRLIAASEFARTGSTIEFVSDGTLKGFSLYSYWKQSGSNVYGGTSADFEISDKNLFAKVGMSSITLEREVSGIKYQVIYKKK